SAFHWTRPMMIEGVTLNGDVPNVFGLRGRVTVIKDRPLLELLPNAQGGLGLTLYGRPGVTYDIESTPGDPGEWDWQQLRTLTLEGLFQTVPATIQPG